MWNPSENNPVLDAKSGLIDDDKCGRYDSSTDSGFLSSANLLVSSTQDSGVIDEADVDGDVDAEKNSMHLDSGVDVGLSETFSGLNLSPSLNNLNSAIRTNDDDVKKAVQERPPWEIYYQQDDDGDTQLHIAVIHGFIEVVYSLIHITPYQCLLDIPNDHGQSALHLSVLLRQPRITRRLVAAGASPKARDLRGNTPLHLACALGDLQAVKELTTPVTIQEAEGMGLKYNAERREIDFEQRNYDGQMCVHLAALYGHVDVLRHLVWFGANINAREGKSGYTPLHQAIENNDQATTQFLLAECSELLQLEAPTYGGRTALQLARGSAFVQALVARGAHEDMDDDTDDEYDTDSTDDTPFESSNVYKPGLVINASA